MYLVNAFIKVHSNYKVHVFFPGNQSHGFISCDALAKHSHLFLRKACFWPVPPQTLLFLSQINDLLSVWVPFSSPLTVVSPFLLVWDWTALELMELLALCSCWASLSLNACCLVWTKSGITASTSDRDSIGRPSNTVPSWNIQRPYYNQTQAKRDKQTNRNGSSRAKISYGKSLDFFMIQ